VKYSQQVSNSGMRLIAIPNNNAYKS
jgi:hypothetical protein